MNGKPVPPEDGPEERQPILHIKKGAERDVPIYYEKLKRRWQNDSCEEERPRRGGFPLFRSGRFSLLPLLILVLGAVVVFRMLPSRDRSAAVVEGMSISLRAVEYQGAVRVSLSFSGEIPGSPVPISVTCMLEGREEPLSLSGQVGEGSLVLRGSMDGAAAGKTLTAEVTVGNVRRTLKRTVQRTQD